MGAFNESTFAHGSDKEAVKLRPARPKQSKHRSRYSNGAKRSYEESCFGPGNSERCGRGYTPSNRPLPHRMVQHEKWEWTNNNIHRPACDLAQKLDTVEEFPDFLPVESAPHAPVEVDLLDLARPSRRLAKGKTPLRAEYEFLDGNTDLLSWADDSEWNVETEARFETGTSDWESDWESTADWEDLEDDFYAETSTEEARRPPTYAEMLKERPR